MGWQSESVFQVLIIEGTAGAGLFVYDAAGVLIAAITANGGTGPQGGSADPGIESIADVGGIQTGTVALSGGTVAFGSKDPAVLLTAGAQISEDDVSSASLAPFLSLIAPTAHTPRTRAQVYIYGESQDGTVTPQVLIGSSFGQIAPQTAMLLEVQGSMAVSSQVLLGATTAGTTAELEVHSLIALAARTAPGTPPAGFGFLYVSSVDGSLHYKGASGTDTKIAAG